MKSPGVGYEFRSEQLYVGFSNLWLFYFGRPKSFQLAEGTNKKHPPPRLSQPHFLGATTEKHHWNITARSPKHHPMEIRKRIWDKAPFSRGCISNQLWTILLNHTTTNLQICLPGFCCMVEPFDQSNDLNGFQKLECHLCFLFVFSNT